MKRHLFFILISSFFACVHAETIVLRTGARVTGTVVFQNEEVIVIRNAEGARSQYPRADVSDILSDEAAQSMYSEEQTDEPVAENPEDVKKASILLELAGGAAVIPAEKAGGAVGADLLVGSHHIGSRHVFIGAGVGYQGLFLGGEKYNFLPVLAAVRFPFTEKKHAPVGGLSLGYGIALSRNYTGGLVAGIDLGYIYRLSPKTAVSILAYARFQQASVPAVVVLDGADYTALTGRNIVTSGLKFAFYF